jgi:predicted O-linked N-acetylglucosamine transferase (SPINDLY family)
MLKTELWQNLSTCPLFSIEAIARNREAAYFDMIGK